MYENLVRMTLGVVLCAAVPACSQVDPMTSTGDASESGQDPTAADGTDTDPPPPLDGDYYPLVDGATWTYRHTDSGGLVWNEVVHMREVDYQGMTAYEAEDNEDANNESTLATLVRNGTMTLRVHKDVSLAGVSTGEVDYDPGFLRFDEGWQDGESIQWTYDRTEYDAMGIILSQNPRDMIFTIESMSTEVTVPAGTFNCVQVLRERVDNSDRKRYWFARGVGKVRHESLVSGSTEELVEYAIP